MKFKLLIIVMSVVLFVNSYDLRVFASGASHEDLIQYPGYAESLYESVIEEKAFLGASYTENKEYVERIRDELKSGAKSFFNEMTNIESPTDIMEKIISGGFTVGEWIKKYLERFNDSEQIKVDEENKNLDYANSYLKYFRWNGGVQIADTATLNNYIVSFVGNGEEKEWSTTGQASYIQDAFISSREATDICGGGYAIRFMFHHTGAVYFCDLDKGREWQDKINSSRSAITDPVEKLRNELNNAMALGLGTIRVVERATSQPVSFSPIEKKPNNFTMIKNYIENDTTPTRIKPLSATLVCPGGKRISIKHNGSTFLDKNGQVMQVGTDGTATVDSSICTLEWEKPIISFAEDGKVTIEQDGVTTDIDTGEDIDFDDEIEDGCGTICAIGKMLTGLGTIAKAIAAIPLKILDGLLELIKKILIPEENFWDSNLGELKDKFFHDEVKEVQQGIEGLTSAGGGQFGDVTGSLMGVDNLKIIDSSSINMSLDTLHSWVRGFFYPLLLFFNINQMYRVIRGTSLVGIGGKKDE